MGLGGEYETDVRGDASTSDPREAWEAPSAPRGTAKGTSASVVRGVGRTGASQAILDMDDRADGNKTRQDAEEIVLEMICARNQGSGDPAASNQSSSTPELRARLGRHSRADVALAVALVVSENSRVMMPIAPGAAF